jgi:hypothetical protein
MRRRLFTLLSALSLALCVVTAVLWVRSYSYLEGFFWAPDLPHEFEIGSRRGTIYFGYDVDIGYDVSIGRSSRRRTGFASVDIRGDAHLWVPSEWNVLGFGLHKDNFAHWVGPIRKSGHALYVPSWFVLGATLVLPSLRAVRMLRARRRPKQGLCPSCGYDLRATPDRCPECGTRRAGP